MAAAPDLSPPLNRPVAAAPQAPPVAPAPEPSPAAPEPVPVAAPAPAAPAAPAAPVPEPERRASPHRVRPVFAQDALERALMFLEQSDYGG